MGKWKKANNKPLSIFPNNPGISYKIFLIFPFIMNKKNYKYILYIYIIYI